MRGDVKLTVQPVGPGVIGAGDMADAPFSAKKLMRPVLADIVEGAKRIIAVTDDDDGTSGDIRCDIGPRLAQLLDMAHPLPGMREHRVLFKGEPVGACIGFGLQRQGRGRVGVVPCADALKIIVVEPCDHPLSPCVLPLDPGQFARGNRYLSAATVQSIWLRTYCWLASRGGL